jgi:hypothetical protein
MSERIGFYICHCGINIAYRVRVQEVAEYVGTLPKVVPGRNLSKMIFGITASPAWSWPLVPRGCTKKPSGPPASELASIHTGRFTW